MKANIIENKQQERRSAIAPVASLYQFILTKGKEYKILGT